jgi:polysaccharide chain length determinant protein (PEP-CTERM system associated)
MEQVFDQIVQQLRAIWLRRYWGLVAAWSVTVVGLAYSLLVPGQYEATARVYVDTESVLKPLMVGLAVQPNVTQQVEILGRTLLSRPNLERLVQTAQLDRDVETQQQRNALIERVAKRIEVTGSKPDLFSLSYRDTDPARAKRTIETLLSIFVESCLINKRRDTDKAMQFLDAQIGEYEVVLGQAEKRLKDFKLQNFEHLGLGQDSVASMVALDNEMEKARNELRAAEQRRDAVKRQLESEKPLYMTHKVDSRRELLQRNLDDLLLKYTDDHPDVVNARQLLAELDGQRRNAVAEGANGVYAADTTGQPNIAYQQLKVSLANVEGDLAEARAKLAGLQERYNKVRASARLKPELEEQLAQLNREYQVQKNNFEQLVGRRESAKLTGQLDQSAPVDFRVIDPPRVSSEPVEPSRLRLITTVFVLSILAGIGASYLMSQMFPTMSSAKELRVVAQRPVLGAISLQSTDESSRHRKRANLAFAGAVVGLIATIGTSLAAVLLHRGL